MKTKLFVWMLVLFMSCECLAYGTAESNHWAMKELEGYKPFIVPYGERDLASAQNAISEQEWDSFQRNMFDATRLDNPILIDDWATALKMATALADKDRETLINNYVHKLGQGTEITRENAVGGMVKLLIGSYIKGNWSGKELQPAKTLLDYIDINEHQRNLVEIAYVQGVLDTTVQNKFRPNDKLTNAEAISMMLRVMEKLAYRMPILPANHWLTDELEAAYNSGMLPKPMLKVLRRTFNNPSNADRNIPVGLWHEMLLTGLSVPANSREKASLHTLAYNQNGGILRDRAVVGITMLGKNPRSATSEEKINAENAFTDYRGAFDPDKIAVAYGEGLLKGQSGQTFGVNSYLTFAEAAALAVRASLRTGELMASEL